MKQSMFKYWEGLLGLLGLALLGWTIHRIGYDSLREMFHHFGFLRLLALSAFYGLFQFLFCLAWRCTIVGPTQKKFLRQLFIVYLAADALNMTIPSANLAGEPVKVLLLKNQMSIEKLITSITLYKMVDFFSMTIFLTIGLLVQSLFFHLPGLWVWGGAVVAFGMAMGSVLLFFLQKNGFFSPLTSLLDRFSWTKNLGKKLSLLNESNQEIHAFFDQHRARIWLATAIHFLAWTGGAVEIFIFLKLIGHPASFAAALVIETFSLFINNVAFFVPGRLGVIEGGRVVLFHALGYPLAAGLAYSLVRRSRELLWIAAGFTVLFFRKKMPSAEQ